MKSVNHSDKEPVFNKLINSPIHTDSLQIHVCFSTLERGFENIRIRGRIGRTSVDGSRIAKEDAADSKLKYPDTC